MKAIVHGVRSGKIDASEKLEILLLTVTSQLQVVYSKTILSYCRNGVFLDRRHGMPQIEPEVDIQRALMFHDHRTRTQECAILLGKSKRGYRGRVQAIKVLPHHCDLPDGELERRLIELGFTEGAHVEILHEGLFGRDPIAVRVNDSTVAIRRREAMAIIVEAFEAL